MSGTLHVLWTIVSNVPPRPLLHCSRCRRERPFASSGKFRLNANGRKLDAWLVYRCAVCGDSFNRPFFERRSRGEIAPELIEALHRNDPVLARRVAFDRSGDWAGAFDAAVEASVLKRLLAPMPTQPERVAIRIVAEEATDRADRLIARGLGMSRGELDVLARSGVLEIAGGGRKALARPLQDGALVGIDLTGWRDVQTIALRAAGMDTD